MLEVFGLLYVVVIKVRKDRKQFRQPSILGVAHW